MRIVELIQHLDCIVETHSVPDKEREAAALAVNMLYRARKNLGIDWDAPAENLYTGIDTATTSQG